jgi:hypothetical protein
VLVPLHGIASRHDLPLPFSYVVGGACVALAVSFAVLLLAWRRPRYARVGGTPLPRLTRVVDAPGTRAVAQLLVLLTYAWAAMALLLGRDRLTNPAFGFVYVWMWVGLVPLSLLLGQVWRATNPLRTLHRLLCAAARTDPDTGLLRLPPRLGVWPAAVGLFGFAWLELVQPERTTLPVLRVWALGWVVVLVLGAVVFGQRWIGAADPFEAYARSVAQLSPWRRVGDELRLVNPLAGLTAWRPPHGVVGVVAALLGSTAFDSFANTSWWIRTVQSSEVSTTVWASVALALAILVVLGTFAPAAAWMARYGDRPAAAYPRLMAGSLVPIVIGYAVAHYLTLLVAEGQRTAIAWSDPLGRGWDVFGSAHLTVDNGLYAHPTAIAVVQAGAIVLGHVVGIGCAHEKAVALLPADAALRGQLPMLVVMLGYTCAGLLLLFSP